MARRIPSHAPERRPFMEDLKIIIAQNIIELRKSAKITQAELAEKLNYSDKAVSKWERGESIPDIAVLKAIADLFSVKVDYLLEIHGEDEKKPILEKDKKNNHVIITLLSCLLVWFIFGILFVSLYFPLGQNIAFVKMFVVCVPINAIITLVFNSIWGNRRRNYLIISLLVWSALASVYILVGYYQLNLAVILAFCGLLAQLIIFLWSRLNYKK